LTGQAQRRSAEHLQRADQVERLHAGKADDDHRSLHVFSVCDPQRGVYAMNPTDQDISG
jgi:hypothetical protein